MDGNVAVPTNTRNMMEGLGKGLGDIGILVDKGLMKFPSFLEVGREKGGHATKDRVIQVFIFQKTHDETTDGVNEVLRKVTKENGVVGCRFDGVLDSTHERRTRRGRVTNDGRETKEIPTSRSGVEILRDALLKGEFDFSVNIKEFPHLGNDQIENGLFGHVGSGVVDRAKNEGVGRDIDETENLDEFLVGRRTQHETNRRVVARWLTNVEGYNARDRRVGNVVPASSRRLRSCRLDNQLVASLNRSDKPDTTRLLSHS